MTIMFLEKHQTCENNNTKGNLMIINELVDYAVSMANNRKIKDFRAGLGYTAVILDDFSCGLAYTFRNELGSHCGTISEAGSIIDRAVSEAIP